MITFCDGDICAKYCRMFWPPSCDEEHEAWHAVWIEASVSCMEYVNWRMREIEEEK